MMFWLSTQRFLIQIHPQLPNTSPCFHHQQVSFIHDTACCLVVWQPRFPSQSNMVWGTQNRAGCLLSHPCFSYSFSRTFIFTQNAVALLSREWNTARFVHPNSSKWLNVSACNTCERRMWCFEGVLQLLSCSVWTLSLVLSVNCKCVCYPSCVNDLLFSDLSPVSDYTFHIETLKNSVFHTILIHQEKKS